MQKTINITGDTDGKADAVVIGINGNLGALSVQYSSDGNMGGGELKAYVSVKKDLIGKVFLPDSDSVTNNKTFTIDGAAGDVISFEMTGSTNPNQNIHLAGNFEV